MNAKNMYYSTKYQKFCCNCHIALAPRRNEAFVPESTCDRGMSTEAGNGQQAPTLDEALAIVRTNKGRMLQCLDTFKLMDGLKHASTMLSELRTCALGPKQYYELCKHGDRYQLEFDR